MYSFKSWVMNSAVVMCVASGTCVAGEQPQTDLIARGKYLSIASDCAACHTVKGGAEFAGGLAIVSPVGKIFASNITPSNSAGIGLYSEGQFSSALRKGIRRDGANLYPAMPYASYSALSDVDIKALYAYFKDGVKAVDTPAPKTSLPFPMNIRMSMKAWNLLFLPGRPMKDDPGQSSEWNRGRYLVEGAAHCAECHTPRGLLMQKKSGSAMSGGLVGAWYAPNITSDPISGIGIWSNTELVEYLRTGKLHGKAQAAGSMAEAVEDSFQYLTDQDLSAIATYIRRVPAINDEGESNNRFSQGKASSETAVFRGVTSSTSLEETATGAQLFQGNCASCHLDKAQGTRDGYYPSLFHNSATGSINANNLVATILNGVDRTTTKGQVYMPGFGGKPADLNALSDTQIVSLANYILSNYGQLSVKVTSEIVATVRQGGPASNLILWARIGMAGGALIVVLLGVWWLRRRSRSRTKGTASFPTS
ncbi:cytochrome c [Pseudomonas sp. ES3-33]|uniref:cytochrome c n=1 Tax=Pseudomonas sp. ES3-33 TaxID=1628833 RepID=UPI000696A62F|nr:cytochrome c [Pseudomonas sp. ES3-33]